jgi:hypothetical protein
MSIVFYFWGGVRFDKHKCRPHREYQDIDINPTKKITKNANWQLAASSRKRPDEAT